MEVFKFPGEDVIVIHEGNGSSPPSSNSTSASWSASSAYDEIRPKISKRSSVKKGMVNKQYSNKQF